MGGGAPLGGEPAGDFAEDHAGPQGTLAFVVGGGHIAAGNEDKKITAAFADTPGELFARPGGGGDRQQPVQPSGEDPPQRKPGAGPYSARGGGPALPRARSL